MNKINFEFMNTKKYLPFVHHNKIQNKLMNKLLDLFHIFMYCFGHEPGFQMFLDVPEGGVKGTSSNKLCNVDQLLLLSRVYTVTLSQTWSGVRIRSGFILDFIFKARKITDWIKQTIIVFIYRCISIN